MGYLERMDAERDPKTEFIAKTITDLGKGVVLVGLASYLFEKFPFGWRIVLSVLSIALIVTGIVLYPERGDKS